MSEASIPVDLLNPGQVFACVGFLEAADVLLGGALCRFDWANRGHERFLLRARGETNPFETVLAFVAGAKVRTLVPHGSRHADVDNALKLGPEAPFPFPDPSSDSELPAILIGDTGQLVIDHWGDTTRRDALKFWGGAGGKSGTERVASALDSIRECAVAGVAVDPFSFAAEHDSCFRFDWRREYIAIDAGFSLNRHDKITPLGYPFVEIMAAIGLTHSRPKRPSQRDPLTYTYGVVAGWHEPVVVRAALGDATLPFVRRRFQMKLGKPNKYEKCITVVTEETLSD